MFIAKFNNNFCKIPYNRPIAVFNRRISHTNGLIDNICRNYYLNFFYYSSKVTVSNKTEVTQKKEDSSLIFDESGVIKCTKDQWLYKPTSKEIDLFLNSNTISSRPINLENSVAINLVDLNKDVVSPIKNSVLFSEYGIRKGEGIRLFIGWLLFTSAAAYLGVWQLKRKKWKEQLLEHIKESLNLPKVTINSVSEIKSQQISSHISNNLIYRVVEAHGVLDTEHKFLVGPRKSMMAEHGDRSGYYVLYPLRFRDGSSILINMGWLSSDDVFDIRATPEWVTVRGVLVQGEISEKVIQSLKFKFLSKIQHIIHSLTNAHVDLTSVVNKPHSTVRDDKVKVYRYLDPDSISSQIFSTEPSVTQRYLLNVYDSYFDEDKPQPENSKVSPNSGFIKRLIKIAGITKYGDQPDQNSSIFPRYNFQRKQKSDYLLFYADPGTHFNYAMQWFLMGASVTCMCIYKVFRVLGVLRRLKS